MRLFKRKKVNYKEALTVVSVVSRVKRSLAVILAVTTMLSSIPWTNIKALEYSEPIVENVDVNKQDTQLPNYPTTTDKDFDPSKVEIESEVLSKRTANTKTFRKIDGTYEMAVYNDIIHYYKDGKWEQIDNRLTDNGDVLETKDNRFKLKFPKYLDDNKDIKLSLDNYMVDWRILNIDSSLVHYENEEAKSNNIKDLTNINQSVSYESVQPNVNVEYTVTGSKIKENIILNQYIENYNIAFEYKVKDLTIIKDEEDHWVFVNGENDVIFRLNDFVMYDQDLNQSTDIAIDVIEIDNKTYTISITPSDEWLQSASFPVKIDPTITLDGIEDMITDKYVDGYTSYSSTSLFNNVGIYSNRHYKSYLDFNLTQIPNNVMVNYAHLSIQMYPYENHCSNNCTLIAKEVYDTDVLTNISAEGAVLTSDIT